MVGIGLGIRELNEVLAAGLYRQDFSLVVAQIRAMGPKARTNLLMRASKIINNRQSMKNERLRVAAVKCLLAMLPDSQECVKKLLSASQGTISPEVHFTLFCFLDRIRQYPEGAELAREVPSLVGAYLMSVRSSAALAPWMAGDLLGDHWELSVSLPYLVRTAQNAKYGAGRKGAVHGLEAALARTKGRKRIYIESILHKIASTDKSKSVRIAAGGPTVT